MSRPSRRSSAAAQEAARRAAAEQAQRRRDRRRLVGVVALVLVVVAGWLGYRYWTTQRLPTGVVAVSGVVDAAQTPTPGRPLRFGVEGAPVTVQLWSDFHCPHCVDLESELGPTLTRLQAEGTVGLELFPMAFVDAGSAPAANAMACAAEAGFGERYYRGLFTHADLAWTDDDQLLALAGLAGGPGDGGFTDCVTGDRQAGYVASIGAAAEAAGVEGTPTLVVGGERVADATALTRDQLQSLIESKR